MLGCLYMHQLQAKLLDLARHQDIGGLSLRQIADLLEVRGKPQIVKHHLLRLEKAGLMRLDFKANIIQPIERGYHSRQVSSIFYSLPIVGTANCGPATIFADERIQGYLKVSAQMLPRKKQDLYVIVADGLSMNKAEVHDGLTIEDGDFVVVDSSYRTPKNGDIVVAVIDGMGTIKRYRKDKKHDRIVLEADSTEKYLPIFVHESDDFVISGKVVDVIKKNN